MGTACLREECFVAVRNPHNLSFTPDFFVTFQNVSGYYGYYDAAHHSHRNSPINLPKAAFYSYPEANHTRQSKLHYGLRRFARNDDAAKQVRHNNPTGKAAKTCPALRAKIFRLRRRANQR